MGFELGRRIGDYEFIDVEDSSRVRVAYKVRNVPLNRMELLRVLSKPLQADQERSSRFLREASVHHRLVHPNIVAFYGALVLEEQFVITTEIVEGVTLAERLELGAISLPHAISYLDQVLAALACAHGHGVVHRDITPGNIILTPEEIVKLTGFSLAKSAADPQVTQAGTTLGPVHYMSPEQVRGEATLDVRSDLYSVGVVLYEMLTGTRPFHATSQFDVMMAHINSQPAPASHVRPELQPEIDSLVLKALAKEPSQRFQSAEEFRTAAAGLFRKSERIEQAGLAEAVPEVRSAATTDPLWLRISRAGPELALLGLGLVAVVAAALLALRA